MKNRQVKITDTMYTIEYNQIHKVNIIAISTIETVECTTITYDGYNRLLEITDIYTRDDLYDSIDELLEHLTNDSVVRINEYDARKELHHKYSNLDDDGDAPSMRVMQDEVDF